MYRLFVKYWILVSDGIQLTDINIGYRQMIKYRISAELKYQISAWAKYRISNIG